jgi:hypothetical protein
MPFATSLALLLASASARPPAATIWIDTLDLAHFAQRRGRPRANQAFRGGGPLRMGGMTFAHGIGTQSVSEFVNALGGNARRFRATVGLDDTANDRKHEGTVRFQIWTDDRLVADSGVMKVGDAPRLLDADLSHAKTMTMRLDDGEDTSNGDLGDWADARTELADAAGPRPAPFVPSPSPVPVLATPDTQLAIHGPLVVGTTPGKPFLFRIPATGSGPLRFPPPACRQASRSIPLPASCGETSGMRGATMCASPSATAAARRHARSASPPAPACWPAPRRRAGTAGTAGVRPSTMQKCAPPPTRWSRAGWPRTASIRS